MNAFFFPLVIGLSGLVLGLGLSACSDDCPVGSEGCACSSVAACYAGLECRSDVCEIPEGTSTGTGTGTGTAGSESDGTSSETSTGSEGTGGTAATGG